MHLTQVLPRLFFCKIDIFEGISRILLLLNKEDGVWELDDFLLFILSLFLEQIDDCSQARLLQVLQLLTAEHHNEILCGL